MASNHESNFISFDLSHIEASKRFEFWHDEGSLVHRPVESSEVDRDSLFVTAKIALLEEIATGRMSGSTQTYERTSKMIKADHVDSFLLTLVESGTVGYASHSGSFFAQQGDILLIDQDEPSCSHWSAHKQIYVSIPRIIIQKTGEIPAGTQHLPASSASAMILGQYLRLFWNQCPLQILEENIKLMKGLACLTQIYFGKPGLQPESIAPYEEAESLISIIKRWINENLHRQDLCPEEICSTFHLSRSALYSLFQPHGGVRSYLQQARLERARQLLISANHRMPVGEVAKRLGFGSLSSFTRAFTNHWGLSPREFRRQEIRTGKNPQVKPEINKSEDDTLRKNIIQYYKTVQGRRSES
jgi:AraC-like DNA-binding protein